MNPRDWTAIAAALLTLTALGVAIVFRDETALIIAGSLGLVLAFGPWAAKGEVK